jgi:hypothetical protein
MGAIMPVLKQFFVTEAAGRSSHVIGLLLRLSMTAGHNARRGIRSRSNTRVAMRRH